MVVNVELPIPQGSCIIGLRGRDAARDWPRAGDGGKGATSSGNDTSTCMD
jgi:hypothetical protein